MDYRTMAVSHARRAGVDPDLFLRLIQQESSWNPEAVSPVGAFGLTQIMPATARQPGYKVKPMANMVDPDEQLRFGADYLAAMLNRFDGDTDRALAAYNWGPGNAAKWNGAPGSLPEETRNYVAKVNGVGFGPTRARAAAGLPLARAGAEGAGLEEDTRPGWKKKGDDFLAKLGFPTPKEDNNGMALAQLGLRMMNGGF